MRKYNNGIVSVLLLFFGFTGILSGEFIISSILFACAAVTSFDYSGTKAKT